MKTHDEIETVIFRTMVDGGGGNIRKHQQAITSKRWIDTNFRRQHARGKQNMFWRLTRRNWYQKKLIAGSQSKPDWRGGKYVEKTRLRLLYWNLIPNSIEHEEDHTIETNRVDLRRNNRSYCMDRMSHVNNPNDNLLSVCRLHFTIKKNYNSFLRRDPLNV